ncbi:MAG: AraC family transcriptional regulator [Acidaminobacter sp.]|uniref:helix-turn-helix domain-containing protein n=1 Tax=Acidaminobacter sp. TaxID=1872102 RepID=UPI0013815AD5|nr:AraC family transcriptional regulator [Acidaminobacter sp.]MZQ99200.1 AraC family transcriptional regulator [Acidaminobacter sp.]
MEKNMTTSVFSLNPSAFAKEHLYYVELAGEYFGISDYKIERDYLDSLLLMYIEKGELQVEQGEKVISVGRGECVFLDCRKPHKYSSKESITFKWVHFRGNSVFAYSELLTKEYGEPIVIKDPTLIEQEFKFLMGLLRSESSLEHMLSVSIHRLLAMLSENGSARTKSADLAVASAEAYLRQNFEKQLSITEVASEVGLSVFYFTRQFQKQYGISPYEYLITQRISNAKRLLLNSGMSIRNISAACGYNNPSIFIASFKSRVGMTPTQFRRSINGNIDRE